MPVGPNGLPLAMEEMAKGPRVAPMVRSTASLDQLPQIFIKEAQVVRRTLIFEEEAGIPLRLRPSLSDVVQGLGRELPPVTGMVLTSVKKDPLIDMPIVAGKSADPLLAHWQTGLGKAAVFTSDAHTKWASRWVNSRDYSKFGVGGSECVAAANEPRHGPADNGRGRQDSSGGRGDG